MYVGQRFEELKQACSHPACVCVKVHVQRESTRKVARHSCCAPSCLKLAEVREAAGMDLPPDLILICTAGIVLLGNSQRSPKKDRTAVASAAFVALLLGLAAQLPYRVWYIFSIICLFIYGMVVLCAAVLK